MTFFHFKFYNFEKNLLIVKHTFKNCRNFHIIISDLFNYTSMFLLLLKYVGGVTSNGVNLSASQAGKWT